MKKEFYQDVINSGYIHRPLRIDSSKSLEAMDQQAQILSKEVLFSPEHQTYQWKHYGRGKSYIKDSQMIFESSQVYDSWPEGAPDDGDYTNYGQVGVTLQLNHLNIEKYNRIYIKIKPICPGMVNPHIMISIKNDGKIKVPDIYNREGYHTANLIHDQWNECSIDISSLPRDAISEITFSVLINGNDRGTVNHLKYIIEKIQLVESDYPTIDKGWQPLMGEIIYSHDGYEVSARKIAIMNDTDQEFFEIIDEQGKTVFSQDIQRIETSIGKYVVLDFSSIEKKGVYRIKIGNHQTPLFSIDSYQHRWHESIYRVLNFIFCERCGCPVPGLHGSCHEDIIAHHNGVSIIFNGGWHDAGDVSQQLVQTAEVTLALFQMSQKVKDEDLQLSLRLEEEAQWGLDFILKTRFQDGYRATIAGVTRWSDCLIGNKDDTVCRVHNNAYENFYLAGIEASMACVMGKNDRLYPRTREIAEEDFQFALIEFEKHGFKHDPIFWEHTYNMSKSLFLATMVWSGCQLYRLTYSDIYQEYVKKWVKDLLECQEIDGIPLYDQTLLKGFFYRDEKHQVIQHFNHQSREHLYICALIAVLECHVDDKNKDIYENRLKLYGDYLVYLSKYTQPYPMLSSGVYLHDEYQDDESFQRQHLLIGDEAKENYVKQLYQGEHISQNLYLKRFPVWFSFRGNNAILLSQAKAASLIGKYFHDQKLMEIAEGQLQWLIGFNPFGQSLMYGEGHHYASQYSVLTGEMVGEIPVGIQTWENDDEPYWPQFTNATYKEVWVGLAGKWLDVLYDLYSIESEERT